MPKYHCPDDTCRGSIVYRMRTDTFGCRGCGMSWKRDELESARKRRTSALFPSPKGVDKAKRKA